MKERILFVDFENVQKLDLSSLADDFRITIFVGNSQKNIPIDLVRDAQRFGSRLEWVKISGEGSNALDFHIAFYLGRLFEKLPKAVYFVLSRDKGFDPLLRHLTEKEMSCKRINSLMELRPSPPPSEDPNLKRVVDLLSKIEKKSRPRKRSTLSQHIASMFQKKITDSELERLMDLLFDKGLVSESNKVLSYNC